MRRYNEQKPIVSPFLKTSLYSFNRSQCAEKRKLRLSPNNFTQNVDISSCTPANGICVFANSNNESRHKKGYKIPIKKENTFIFYILKLFDTLIIPLLCPITIIIYYIFKN